MYCIRTMLSERTVFGQLRMLLCAAIRWPDSNNSNVSHLPNNSQFLPSIHVQHKPPGVVSSNAVHLTVHLEFLSNKHWPSQLKQRIVGSDGVSGFSRLVLVCPFVNKERVLRSPRVLLL